MRTEGDISKGNAPRLYSVVKVFASQPTLTAVFCISTVQSKPRHLPSSQYPIQKAHSPTCGRSHNIRTRSPRFAAIITTYQLGM